MAEIKGKAELERVCAGVADKLLIGAALNIVAQAINASDSKAAMEKILQVAESKIPPSTTLFGRLDDQQNAVLRAAIVEHMRHSLVASQSVGV